MGDLFGARYYDARTSVWQSADPVLEKYLPNQPTDEGELKELGKNPLAYWQKKLPGGGGVYNSLNVAMFTYGHQNPVKYVDPDGNFIPVIVVVGIAIAAYLSVGSTSLEQESEIDAALRIVDVGTLLIPGGSGARTATSSASVKAIEQSPKLLTKARDQLLSFVKDPKLRNRIDYMFRKEAKIGSGSTADALRYEKATGNLLSRKGHFQKAEELRKGLLDDIRSGRLSKNEITIAKSLLKDIQNALSGD